MSTSNERRVDDRAESRTSNEGPKDGHDSRIFPSGHGPDRDYGRPSEANDGRYHRRIRRDEEGVEVVLGRGNDTVVDGPIGRSAPDQNVFRPPRPVRPRAVRAQGGPPSHVQGSESYGYSGGHPPPGEYGHRSYSVPYSQSGSFEESPYHQQHQYSPHVQYPPHTSRHPEDVNVISPNHKGEQGPRPPVTPRGRHVPPHYYQYPPTSPVSRPGGHNNSPPRLRNYSARGRGEGPYSAAQRGRHPDDGTWNPYPPTSSNGERPQPPLVAESSFDSDHYSSHQSHPSNPTTPNPPHHGPPIHPDSHHSGFYGNGGSFGNGSFDSHAPPPHFDDQRYYGRSSYPPESPYSHYSYHGYSPGGGYYDNYSPHPDYGRPPHSYEDDDHHKGYHPDRDYDINAVSPNAPKSSSNSSGMMLPKAAQEIDFDVTDPPTEPITPPSREPVCDSPADVNSYDVLCGRGGGTNSQIGNRRFRKLVQEFQPTYLLARRKEKPLLARTIVLIIRKRGGRFLKKDEETGELFEVGDAKAEAKTSQALREGLDVRATKSAASSLLDKKKKKKGAKPGENDTDMKEESTVVSPARTEEKTKPPESPPTLPRLQGEEKADAEQTPSDMVHPPSPEAMQFRKRRRMRSGDNTSGCLGGFQDKLFSEFCPPRTDLPRPSGDDDCSVVMGIPNTPQRRNIKYEEDDVRYEAENMNNPSTGCAGIALDMVTGAAVGSFCLGPRKWR